MKFLDNKYTKWYFSIINYAKLRTTTNNYIERHHIIPKSLGGSNLSDNIVKLLAREHFVCHILLTKMTSNIEKYKMIHAAIGMKRARKYQDRYINSRLYENIKKEYANISRIRNTGRVATAETRSKMSIASKGKQKTAEHAANISKGSKGKPKKPMPEALKKQISEKLKGRPSVRKGTKGKYQHSDEAKQKIIESNKRRTYSVETRLKLSIAAKESAAKRKLLKEQNT